MSVQVTRHIEEDAGMKSRGLTRPVDPIPTLTLPLKGRGPIIHATQVISRASRLVPHISRLTPRASRVFNAHV